MEEDTARGAVDREQLGARPRLTCPLELEAAGQSGSNSELLALNRTSTGLLMQSLASIVLLLILLDMIFKPGA